MPRGVWPRTPTEHFEKQIAKEFDESREISWEVGSRTIRPLGTAGMKGAPDCDVPNNDFYHKLFTRPVTCRGFSLIQPRRFR